MAASLAGSPKPELLPVAEARARVLAGLGPLPAEIVGLDRAAGRVLAQPVRARVAQPPQDVSAMDGYALRAADGGGPRRVIGRAAAGRPYAGTLGPGEAVRVFTGSAVPAGADSVMLQEDADHDGATLRLRNAPAAGQHIRRFGQDFAAGEPVLPAGRRLGPRDIGLAAAANHPWVAVHRQPAVAVLCTGDEIAMPGEPIPSAGIPGSNGPMLAALIAEAGGIASLLPIAADNPDAIAAAADLLITTGGASVGEHDLVRAGLEAGGMKLDFWRIAMRPGKPMLHGRIGAMPVLGLPGNPVSAYICATLFLLPALRILGGESGEPETQTALLAAALGPNDHRADHLRARLRHDPEGRLLATPFGRQDSAMLSVLAAADCLILRPPYDPALPPGSPVRILRL